uniref:Uncharacterized protein n=1 Tax=Polynucleobacter necessarius subsp. necessarius (strain STIR1) TaxID=452638 RepID=B1XUY3_POLNS
MHLPNNLRLYLFESNLLPLILFITMLLMVEIGWRVGKHFASKYHLKKIDASDTFMAAIFGLLALFTLWRLKWPQ